MKGVLFETQAGSKGRQYVKPSVSFCGPAFLPVSHDFITLDLDIDFCKDSVFHVYKDCPESGQNIHLKFNLFCRFKVKKKLHFFKIVHKAGYEGTRTKWTEWKDSLFWTQRWLPNTFQLPYKVIFIGATSQVWH